MFTLCYKTTKYALPQKRSARLLLIYNRNQWRALNSKLTVIKCLCIYANSGCRVLQWCPLIAYFTMTNRPYICANSWRHLLLLHPLVCKSPTRKIAALTVSHIRLKMRHVLVMIYSVEHPFQSTLDHKKSGTPCSK